MVRKLADKFGGKFLKAAHFPRPRKMVVKTMSDEKMPDKEVKTVCWFEGEERGLVLNKTNATSLCEIAGTDDLDQCAGITAVLYAATTDFGGRNMDCIRIRAPRDGSNDPANAAQNQMMSDAEEDTSDDEIPF